MIPLQPEEYKIPDFISAETFAKLAWKEQDFLVLLHTRRFTRKEIQRFLYIPSKTAYWRFRKKITEIVREEYEHNAVSK